jgi:type VI secretion system secreted protein VgrG
MQQAKVMSNNDPKKQGRIKVQMNWQRGQQQTDWIKVMTPDAGGPSNRGFVFIPEVGDYVMLGFRYNDPNRPFVIGSVFNGTTGAGGGSGNNSKTIKTKSGSTIAFQEDKKSITITDGAGNSVALDGAGNISVSSSASISLSTGSSSLTMKSDGTIDLNGKKVIINGSETLKHNSPKVTITGNQEVVVTSPLKVDINSAAEVIITGTAQATLSSSAITAVEGTIIKLN